MYVNESEALSLCYEVCRKPGEYCCFIY